jgi:NADH-quinone oxidoreductase subunit G
MFGSTSLEVTRALADPALQATVPDIEYAHTVLLVGCDPLDDASILDLRIRKGVRRRGVQLAIATDRPTALDVNAQAIVRYEPGEAAAFLSNLADELSGGAEGELARLLREGGEDVVILWGERIGSEAAATLLRIAESLGLRGREGAGLLEIPAGTNGRGLREVGAIPNAGPGYTSPASDGRGAAEIGEAAAGGDLTALYLFQTDPVRDLPDRALWERALNRAALVVAHASVLTEGLREHANVIFPAESYAEKEGTVVHPDGRLQRLRIAIAHPGQVRASWSVVAEIAKRVGLDTGVETSSMVFEQLVEAVPFYAGLTLEEIGGRGIRWPERAEFDAGPVNGAGPTGPSAPSASAPDSNGALRLGTYRPIWASPEVEISPALHYTVARQQLEISPEDASRLGIRTGEDVQVAQNGTRLRARAAVRSGVPEGTVFLATGVAENSANALTEATVEVGKA